MAEFPVELADRCVKCGLCAPECPTYRLDRMEPESPRGRIAMMQAIATGQIEATAKTREHLDHCLSCQACEAACPAQVLYLTLLDAHRSAHPPGVSAAGKISLRLIRRPALRPTLRVALQILALLRPYLMAATKAVNAHRVTRLLSLAPSAPIRLRGLRLEPATVDVLAGCMGDLANSRALSALQQCLKAAGLSMNVLPTTACCGALPHHLGDPETAQAERANIESTRHRDRPLLVMDSACVSELRRHAGRDLHELCSWLSQLPAEQLPLKPLSETVLIHEPCSHRNGLRERDAARKLLQRIPAIQLASVADSSCCGAAGIHMLEQPERADAMLEPKLQQAGQSDCAYVATTNIGCALHWSGGLRRRGLHASGKLPTVVHPVELIAQQLDV